MERPLLSTVLRSDCLPQKPTTGPSQDQPTGKTLAPAFLPFFLNCLNWLSCDFEVKLLLLILFLRLYFSQILNTTQTIKQSKAESMKIIETLWTLLIFFFFFAHEIQTCIEILTPPS